MKKSILLLLGIAIFITSCKKDDDSDNTNPTPTPVTCLITKTNDLINKSYTDVVYNQSNFIDNIKEYDSTGTFASGFNAVYSSDVLMKLAMQDSTGNDAQIFEYVYNGNEVDTVHLYMDTDSDGALDTLIYYLYTYTSGKISSMSTYYDIGSGNYIEAAKSEYTWTGDNITEVIEYTLNTSTFQLELSKTTTYEFDTKKNYIHNIGLDNMPMATDMMNANNYLKKTVKDANDVIDNDNSAEYTNTYDGDKLTQLIAISFNTDTIQNETRTFTCN